MRAIMKKKIKDLMDKLFNNYIYYIIYYNK